MLIFAFLIDFVLLGICLMKRKRRWLLFLFVPFLLVFLLYQSVGMYHNCQSRAIKMSYLQVRRATATDSVKYSNHCDYPLYVVAFSTNRRLEDIQEYNLRMYCSLTKSDFSYSDVVYDKDKTRFESNDITYIGQEGDAFLYEAPFQLILYRDVYSSDTPMTEITKDDVTDCPHCKVFFVEMLSTIYGTSEMVIPKDSLLRLMPY